MSIRDRLANRPRPTSEFSLRIDNDHLAREELESATLAGDRERVLRAKVAIQACYETLVLTALPAPDLEALIELHRPTAEQLEKKAQWNPETFVPALFAACVSGDVTEDDWAEYIKTGCLTSGEIRTLFDTVWDLNTRAPELIIPLD